MRRKLVALGLLLSAAVPACAEEYGVRQTEFYSQSAGGKPRACAVEFTYVFKDQTYSPGYVAVHGQVVFVGYPQKFFAMLKFGGADFKGGLTKPTTPFPIANASLRVGGKVIPFNRQECEAKDQTYCGGVGFDPAVQVLENLETPGSKLLFNRTPDALDYDLDLIFQPGTDQDKAGFAKALNEHHTCVAALLGEVMKPE